MRIAIAIDHQARIVLRHQRRIDGGRHSARDAKGTDVPGDVSLEFRGGQSKIRQTPRDACTGVVHHDDKGRSTLALVFDERRRFVGGKQWHLRVRHGKRFSLALTHQSLHGLNQLCRIESDAVLEDELHILNVLNILRGVARQHHQVCGFAGGDGSDVLTLA